MKQEESNIFTTWIFRSLCPLCRAALFLLFPLTCSIGNSSFSFWFFSAFLCTFFPLFTPSSAFVFSVLRSFPFHIRVGSWLYRPSGSFSSRVSTPSTLFGDHRETSFFYVIIFLFIFFILLLCLLFYFLRVFSRGNVPGSEPTISLYLPLLRVHLLFFFPSSHIFSSFFHLIF